MKVSTYAATRLVAAFLFLGLANTQVLAQATVRESSADGTQAQTRQPATVVRKQAQPAAASTGVAVSSPAQGSLGFDISYQLQLLQEEIMSLRGLIEEQSFELKRLKQQRIDDYIDLDKRLLEVSKEQESLKQRAVANTESVQGAPQVIQPLPQLSRADERQVYDQAIGELLDKQDYAAAKVGFNNYLSNYNGGTYTPNVYYWLGQIYLTEANDKEAETLFNRILAEYPNHQKAPDAQFKLAKIYFEQGDKQRSRVLLDELATGGSDSARLAQSFIQKNFP